MIVKMMIQSRSYSKSFVDLLRAEVMIIIISAVPDRINMCHGRSVKIIMKMTVQAVSY